ncbi:hypothetical protein TVAG_054840 [Trichomonas vaginalis G3]|uniref:DDE-1 domain-containing protein n=1 Tax=Trichomonas vaginalis (strain ATCC PRA-98 / G3) TaxID=412133 RepID=A2FHW3_TRIV3|nr:DDE endonuclease family [Trichomonas vaginalis G3]EAX95505.1 hypothetical protein TVAG_054840 [Trichomonas vaginalis G3]KAI5498774.1 DDE endonuclease family [Trichomonas vaginalis G3]|eukprot:XP_001308435.1 hypothetical protein [Trichomonas vaginalis G3]
MVCFAANGWLGPSVIVVSKSSTLDKNLKDIVQGRIYLNSSDNGYMNDAIFLTWCHLLVGKINIELRNDDINRKILLLIDSHYTRENANSLIYLQKNNIDVLTYPGKCTASCQPHDVVMSKPFKDQFIKNLRTEIREFKEAHKSEPDQATLKAMVIETAHEAITKVVDGKSAFNAFASCGYLPYNPAKLLTKNNTNYHKLEDSEQEKRRYSSRFLIKGLLKKSKSSPRQKRKRRHFLCIQLVKSWHMN